MPKERISFRRSALNFLAERHPRPKGTVFGRLGGKCHASPPAKICLDWQQNLSLPGRITVSSGKESALRRSRWTPFARQFMDTFNYCGERGVLLLTQERWHNIHPSLKTAPSQPELLFGLYQ